MFRFWEEPSFLLSPVNKSILSTAPQLNSDIFMLRLEVKRNKILTESLRGQQQQQDDPLIGRVIAASLLPQERCGTRMSDGDGEEDVNDNEFDFGRQYNDEVEEESQEDALSASLPVKPLNSIWDCEHLCIATQENKFGRTVSG